MFRLTTAFFVTLAVTASTGIAAESTYSLFVDRQGLESV